MPARKPTFAEYLAIDACNFSSLKHIAESPKTYRHFKTNPIPDTPRFGQGRLTHTALLEPELLDEHYAIFPGATRRGEYWDAFRAALGPDCTILNEDEYAAAIGAAKAIMEDEAFGPLLRDPDRDTESVIVWTDPATRILCKGRVDYSSIVSQRLIDIKTARSSAPRLFGSQAAKLLYHCQIVWYGDGMNHWRAERGLPPIKWQHILLPVELTGAHEVAAYEINDDQIDLARDKNDEMLALLAECRTAQRWPGRVTSLQTLQLPLYAYPVIEDDNEEEAA